MKKTLLSIAIVLGLGLTTFANPGGGLFQRGSDEESYGSGYYSQFRVEGSDVPAIPDHGSSENQDSPLGTGIVLLSVLGGAYLVGKKRREE